MNSRFFSLSVSAGILFSLGILVPMTASAQGGAPGGAPAGRGAERAAAIAAAAKKPTPRLPDGQVDLNGYWRPILVPPPVIKEGDHLYLFGKDHGSPDHYEAAPPDPNPPSYKPEFLAKVKDLNDHEAKVDPSFACAPLGVPRVGAPQQIIQTAKLVVFLYTVDSGGGGGNVFRVIPTDGRPHRTDVDPSFFGDSVAHWDGDTLVVDVNQLTDETWLGQRGYFHSKSLHVTERITRKGDSLEYQATVEDPVVLTKPWVMDKLTELAHDDNIVEVPLCVDFDRDHLVNDDHHGAEDHPR
jgi:hypothetical protein